ncbi:MAG: TetR family transcriptional regulator [Candidatus Dormibacteraeota bacterium]|nr:TetR family transcriptional regulator [Candidatus Dormibacteraeota bacterium]
MTRSGRRPGKSDTREAILDAARTLFAERGYDGTTVRDLGAVAEVDPKLVLHYFGSKEGVFRSAVMFPFDPADVLPRLIAPGVEGLGERLARFFLETLDAPEGRPSLALIRSALSNENAIGLMREFVRREVLDRVAAATTLDRPETRATLAGSQLVGLAVVRYIVKVPPIDQAPPQEVARWVGPTLHRYLTDPALFS